MDSFFLVADRVGCFQSCAALTVIADPKHDFCFTIYKSWFFLKHVFSFLQVFLKPKADVKEEMTSVIERWVIVKKSDL